MRDLVEEVLSELDVLANKHRDFKYEIRKLLEIKAWALDQLNVSDGDAVTLIRDVPVYKDTGWYSYRELLVENTTGIISDLYLYNGEWRGLFAPDVCWVISEYQGERIRTGTKKFMLGLHYMRRRDNTDTGIAVPEDLKEGYHAYSKTPPGECGENA